MVESLSHGSRFMQSFPLNTQQDRREERRGEGRGGEGRGGEERRGEKDTMYF